MNGHPPPTDGSLDVLVVGSGLSGINSAYRLQEALPATSFAILEARHELGGTWSQFRYPGVRSDSDLHTLGFDFYPWRAKKPIASGESILAYLHATAHTFDLERKIRYGHRVVAADWRSEEQRWRVHVHVRDFGSGATSSVVYRTRWIILGTGYYDYDEPLQTHIPGLEAFQGTVVHPQFWPQDLDYQGKKMVVVGSGATTITLLPAMVDTGVGSVTQLQRSPSYVLSLPQDDEVWCERWAPEWLTLRYKRFMFTLVPVLLYKFCIWFPTLAKFFLAKHAASQLPRDFPLDPHFKPGYNPWQQRMCLCPDGDYFKAFGSGKAHIVTDTIKNVVADGIELNSGGRLDADIIVTATGLNMRFLGGIDISVDGKQVDASQQYMWRTSMLTSLPNLGNIIGYWNASWTLGSDTASRLFVKLIKHQLDNRYTSVVPVIGDKDKEKTVSASPLNSTYVTNALSRMPKCAERGPWKPRDNWFVDNWGILTGGLEDGLRWERVAT